MLKICSAEQNYVNGMEQISNVTVVCIHYKTYENYSVFKKITVPDGKDNYPFSMVMLEAPV